jgi:hypothetical protein
MATTGGATLLNQVTVTGDGSVFKTMYPVLAMALQAEISGSPTACVINVLGLIDGATFDTIATLDVSQGYVSGEISMLTLPVLVKQIKGNIGSLSGGNAPSVSLYVAWRD